MTEPTRQVHLAGKPKGLVQKCSRCGYVLIDHRDTMSPGLWRPAWWDGAVEVTDGFPVQFVHTDAPPDCGGIPNAD